MIEAIIAILIFLAVLQFAVIFLLFKSQGDIRNELKSTLKDIMTDSSLKLDKIRDNTAEQLEKMRDNSGAQLDKIRLAVDDKLDKMREDSEKQLNIIKSSVEEKLEKTLSERLETAFKTVYGSLEGLQKSLGAMQELSGGVNDLKKALTNIKTRGTWGEVSLEAILSDILTPEQYEKNANVGGAGCRERVDFAIRLPGAEGETIYLPIDVKFPIADYERLFEASLAGEKESYNESLKQLISTVRFEAKKIHDKYITAKTTDFAVMYLPIEGLYAEILKQSGLIDEIQQKYKVIPAGPTNISAMLSTVRMGFKTLAIQKHSREIYDVLAVFRKEFERFTEIMAKAQGQLSTASKSLEEAGRKTEAITKKLSRLDTIAVPEDADAPEEITLTRGAG